MVFRELMLASVFAVSPILHAACDEFRVVIDRRGQSGFAIRLLDVADRACIPVEQVTLVVTAQDGEVHALTGLPGEEWRRTFRRTFRPSDPFPSFEFRTSQRWWPEDVTLAATVERVNRPPADSKPLTIPMRPPAATALLLAITGALLWSALELEHAKRRDRKTVLTGLAVGLAGGIVAYFAAETTFVWQAVGFEASPLRPQSYFLLGLGISAVGVRRLLQKLTGTQQQDATVVTAADIRNDVMTILSGDVVQRPFRDGVRSIIFDDAYVRRNPELIPRLEFALAAAKKEVTIPDGLTDHIAPRLEPLYAGSYRRNHEIRFEGRLDVSRKMIVWKQTVHYEFIRNPAEHSDQPEVKFSHVSGIPKSMQRDKSERLKSFGPVIQSISLTVREVAGAPLIYDGRTGRSLKRTGAPFGDAIAQIPVTFEHDPRTHEIAARFDFHLPPSLRPAKQVIVDIVTCATARLEDGVAFFRLARVTEGFKVQLEFTPKLHLEIAEFEWKLPGEKPAIIDPAEGSAYLTGWLLPGNGIGIAWAGTKELLDDVPRKDRTPRRMAQRVLDSLWRKSS